MIEEALSPDGRELGSLVSALAVALEGIEQGAVDGGLARGTTRAFVRQTLVGTTLLLESGPGSPAELKDQVASPGGTTIAGLAVLEDRAVRGAFLRAAELAVRPQDVPAGPQVLPGPIEQAGVKVQDPGRVAPSEGREK